MQDYITRKELTERLHISMRTLERLINAGKITAVKLSPNRGGRVLIDVASVNEYLNKNKKVGK